MKKQIAVRLPEQTVELMDHFCEENDISKKDLIQLSISFMVGRISKNKGLEKSALELIKSKIKLGELKKDLL